MIVVRKVLVVEDDRAIRDMIVATLAENGYAVAAARNGAEGLERCRAFVPDVIVLDLMMPEVDGVEFLKRQAQTGCDAPVVLMSAAVQRGHLPPELPVEAFIEKPFAIEKFLDTVATYAPQGTVESHRRRMSRN